VVFQLKRRPVLVTQLALAKPLPVGAVVPAADGLCRDAAPDEAAAAEGVQPRVRRLVHLPSYTQRVNTRKANGTTSARSNTVKTNNKIERTFVWLRALHRRSATTAARGHTRGRKFAASTCSPHIDACRIGVVSRRNRVARSAEETQLGSSHLPADNKLPAAAAELLRIVELVVVLVLGGERSAHERDQQPASSSYFPTAKVAPVSSRVVLVRVQVAQLVQVKSSGAHHAEAARSGGRGGGVVAALPVRRQLRRAGI